MRIFSFVSLIWIFTTYLLWIFGLVTALCFRLMIFWNMMPCSSYVVSTKLHDSVIQNTASSYPQPWTPQVWLLFCSFSIMHLSHKACAPVFTYFVLKLLIDLRWRTKERIRRWNEVLCKKTILFITLKHLEYSGHTIFLDATPCGSLEIYRRFEGA
jgi:hypothetical protein